MERTEAGQPRAILHVGNDPMPLFFPSEGKPHGLNDKQLEDLMRWLVDNTASFWRRTSGDPNLSISYELVEQVPPIRPDPA